MPLKQEIICITRHGFSLLYTEGLDFAAKVTHLLYDPTDKVYCPDEAVKQELLIPRFPGF